MYWSSAESDVTNSVAWGDYDGDGDLDLAVGNGDYSTGQANRLYRNDNGVLTPSAIWSSTESDWTSSVTWGDYDGDGDLDLAVGNVCFDVGPNCHSIRLYRNDNKALTPSAVWSSVESDGTFSVAWGDYDGDGDLDLAVGGKPNRLYRNDNGVLTPSAVWSSAESDATQSVAWGDADGDGDLDLAVGNWGQPNRLYRNDGGVLTPSAVWSSTENDDTQSVAWGDVDGDGDFDLAVGNLGQPNRLYRNEGGLLTASAVWSSAESDATQSVAWGDVDGDGDLDLAAGNQLAPSRLYRNNGGVLTTGADWSSIGGDKTRSVAWGDMDGDGDLDLAVGNERGTNRLYRNDGAVLTTSAVWSSPESDFVEGAAWGDVDGDGDLDLAVGGRGSPTGPQPNRMYRNDGGMLTASAIWSSTESASDWSIARSIAWGDVDGDGDLDLAVGNECTYANCSSIRLYRNDNGVLTPSAIWSSTESDWTTSVAWGDYDGDGDLDLAVGNGGEPKQPNRLYRNDGGVLTTSAVWSSTESDATFSVTWGDYDGDGDLDLVVGNNGQPNRLYRNDNGALTPSAVWSSAESDYTQSLAWGDVDGDGDLDLAVGNSGQPNRLYRNDNGALTPSAVWSSAESDPTNSVAWGDYDGDGDLDLAVVNAIICYISCYGSNRLYSNNAGVLTASAAWPSTESLTGGQSVAWGDMDGDGDLDLATGYQLYRNTRDARFGAKLPGFGSIPVVQVSRPTPPGNADFYSSAQIWSSATIPITYTLTDPQGDRVSSIRTFYSPDGGGRWLPAVAASGTITTNLTTSASGVTHIYTWDVFASGFFGQSDNVVFRIVAVPDLTTQSNSVPGPFMYGSYASQTFPFRVRGTQVRVVSGPAAAAQAGTQVTTETSAADSQNQYLPVVLKDAPLASSETPMANALVYRLPAGQSGAAQPIADRAGQPFHTDGQGYLQGRGQLDIGDKLVALAPIMSTGTYTLYHTSASPTATGLSMYTVSTSGVQTLTVSAANPLILFDVSVSLEWDARRDTQYLEQLQFNLRRASEILYDITNGQAAIGQVTLYQDRERWDEAMLRVYANNRLRPFAAQGGIVITPTVDSATSAIVYNPGQVSMGATWNRYGDAGVTLGEDWPRTLAHELGHYLFFQDDDYLGLNASGQLIPVDTCTGTIMADPYRDDFSELKRSSDWLPGCADTLANKSTGRADWATATTFYPWLSGSGANTGPSSLPLAVTQITVVDPITPTQVLDDPRFYLKDAGGGSLQPGNSARAFLFKPDGLVDLGRPVVDQVLARGAEPGDRVCVFEPASERLGCKTIISNDDQQLTLVSVPGWQPEVLVTPVTSQTVSVRVSGAPPAGTVEARLYDRDGGAPLVMTLSQSGSDFIGTFNLPLPTIEGYVDVQVVGDVREVVADYSLGGNPANKRSGYANKRSGYANKRSGYAPVLSGDGQVIVYGASLVFPQDEFYTVQAATSLPGVPGWATVVGRGYWLSQSAGAPGLAGLSISMGYAQNEVPAGEETYVKVYHWDGVTWTPLTTTVDTAGNAAFATIPGEGLYVLMSAIEIPLKGPGWDAFAYPVQATRLVTDALQSINGYYTTVYWYNSDDTADPWKVYDVGVPSWVNDLSDLQFGEAYWINLTEDVTLRLNGSAAASSQGVGVENFQMPPATYYGAVLHEEGFAPAAGMTVTAWINGTQCGQAQTFTVSGQVVYSMNVSADGPGAVGCGAPGRVVSFQIEAHSMSITASWDNNRPIGLALGTTVHLYLPVIVR